MYVVAFIFSIILSLPSITASRISDRLYEAIIHNDPYKAISLPQPILEKKRRKKEKEKEKERGKEREVSHKKKGKEKGNEETSGKKFGKKSMERK